MKIIVRLVILAALGALALWLWTFFFPSPEKIVRQQLAEFASTATFTGKENPIVRAGKAQKLARFFTHDALVIMDTPEYGGRTLTGSEEIAEAINVAFIGLQSLSVEFVDVNVRIGANRRSADVGLTVKARTGGSKDTGAQEMRFVLKKIDGAWLIARIETVKTLS